MPKRRVITVLLGVSAMALLWLLLGTTSGFRRSPDLIGMVTLVTLGIPLVLIAIVLAFQVLPGKKYDSPKGFVIICAVALLLSVQTFLGVDTPGSMGDHVYKEIEALSPDGKYWYRMELVNPFRTDRQARVVFRPLDGSAAFPVALDMMPSHVPAFSSTIDPRGRWTSLHAGDGPNAYVLEIGNGLNWVTHDIFVVDVATKLAAVPDGDPLQ